MGKIDLVPTYLTVNAVLTQPQLQYHVTKTFNFLKHKFLDYQSTKPLVSSNPNVLNVINGYVTNTYFAFKTTKIYIYTLAPNFMTPRIVTGVYNDGLNYDSFSPKPSN